MYTSEQKQQFSQIFESIAEFLDIPESKYDEAVSRYGTIGKWLDANDSKLHVCKPTIYPQGSFRLGTMVKPVNDSDEYDIDLVCHLESDKDNISQAELKEMVGERLKEHETYRKMLDEGRRCWTITYANEFHMDILPAIPDYEKLNNSILITDKKLKYWQHSNPKGYARWFIERMKHIFEKRKIAMAETMRANVEDVPDYKVRTPLQRSVQLLKRHRDIYFEGNHHKPISIIITTLAGHAYQNEADLFDALVNIINRMVDIQNLKDSAGKFYIPNPTNPDENFADKWNEDERLPRAFLSWLKQLRTDLDESIEQREIRRIKESLGPIFGAGVVSTALAGFVEPAKAKSKTYPEVRISNPNKPWAF